MASKANERNDIVWLYCLVFPATAEGRKKVTEEELVLERNAILDDLNNAKLATQLFYSSTKGQIFCKVGASESRLLLEADIQNYKLRLEPASIKAVAESDADVERYGRAPIFLDYPYPASVEVHHDFEKLTPLGGWKEMTQNEVAAFLGKQTKMSPWDHLHVRYNDAWEARLLKEHGVQIYKTYEDGCILRPADRIRLCRAAIERSTALDPEHKLPGGGVFPKRLMIDKKLLAAYPLQLGTSRQTSKEMTPDQLFTKWNKGLPWDQPLDLIRDYAGEKIALYFCFLGHYTLWLCAPALFGTAIFVHQMFALNSNAGTFNIVGSSVSEVVFDNVTNTFETKINTQVPEAPIFAFFISLWSSFLIEFWKRKQATLALKWGMSDFEESASNRVEFRPTHKVPSPVTGESEEYYSRTSFFFKLATSASVIFMAIGVVIAAIAGILVLKVVMSSPEYTDGLLPASVAPQVALVVNAVVIIILGNVYKGVARQLNDWENHRTDIEYEDHLIAKTFVFSFVNSYATLTYMAFVKSGRDVFGITQYCIVNAEEFALQAENTTNSLPYTKEDVINADACYGSLAYSLFIIFASQIIVNNLMEVGIPFFTSRIKAFLDLRSHAKKFKAGIDAGLDEARVMADGVGDALGVSKSPKGLDNDDEEKTDIAINFDDLSVRSRMKSPLEHQFFLKSYDSTFDDVLEIALQFGYVTLFVAAFPIAPLLALLNNILEVRVDSFKVCILSRRPDITPAQDLGTWQSVFAIIGFAAVISNASVILFTTDFIETTGARRVWLWVAFVAAVLIIKVTVDFLIPDVPIPVQIQLERQAFLERKIFKLERDDEELSPEEKKRNSRRYSMARTIQAVDPFLLELSQRAAQVLKDEKGEGWDAKEIFAAADKNKNGVISLSELKKALLNDPNGLIKALSKYEIAMLVSSMDVDGDGTIDKAEFTRFLNL